MTPIAFLRHRLVRIYQSYFPRELTATEHQFIRKNLTEELTALYYSQPLCDQRHGLLVFEKCQQLFITDAPTEYELLCASIFHDLAKKDCRFSVTQRIFFATMLSVFPYRRRESFANSNVRIFRRISIYDNHSSLSWEMVSPYVSSDFVRDATLYHHTSDFGPNISAEQAQNIELFIQADTL